MTSAATPTGGRCWRSRWWCSCCRWPGCRRWAGSSPRSRSEQRRRRRADVSGRRGRGRDPGRARLLPEDPVRACRPGCADPGVAISSGVRRNIGYRIGNGGRGDGARDHSRAAPRSGADGKCITDREMSMKRLAAVAVGVLAIVVLFPATASARTLSQGMCGPDVHHLQHELGLHKYLPASYTPGCYDYRTSQAVMAYQGWARLTRDGVPVPTQARLKAVTPRPDRPPPLRPRRGHKGRQVRSLIGKLGRCGARSTSRRPRRGTSRPPATGTSTRSRGCRSIPFHVWRRGRATSSAVSRCTRSRACSATRPRTAASACRHRRPGGWPRGPRSARPFGSSSRAKGLLAV